MRRIAAAGRRAGRDAANVGDRNVGAMQRIELDERSGPSYTDPEQSFNVPSCKRRAERHFREQDLLLHRR
jgi:hypothetical protein